MTAGIPLVDLDLQHREIVDEVRSGFDRVLAAKSFVLGPEVDRFERAYADYCGVRHCVGVANGTDAVELALRACGIGPGDEVLAPANTFVATAEAVLRAGARLVLADCDDSYLLDPDEAAGRLTARTRAVLPVHLYGQLAPMKALSDVVGPDVVLIEDAAQSQGASQDGRSSGSFGRAAATSFYPGKNLGAYGDAGAVVTDDAELADAIRVLRDLGQSRKYEHVVIGGNERLDTLQAAVLRVKLRRLDAWNALRRQHAATYAGLLDGAVLGPSVADWADPVWHLYVVRTPARDRVRDALAEASIASGMHYPVPLHLQPALASLGHKPGDFPATEAWAESALSLPMFPELEQAELERIASAVQAAVQ